MLNINDTAH